MGRPKKQTVDYFPHLTGGSRRTIFILEDTWGNDGYAFWFKLLELLSNSDGHYYELSYNNLKYLTSYTKVTSETATEILNLLADLGNIDKELWEQRQGIWCQSLVDNLKNVYDKRTTPMPTRPFSEEIISEKEEETPENAETGEKTEETPPETPPPAPKKSGKKKTVAKKDEPEKIKYADFVKMTEAEHEKLVSQYGDEATARMIEILDNYKGSKNKTYASDYRAILSWVVDKWKEEQAKRGGNGYGENRGHNEPPSPGGFKPSGGFKK